MEAISNVTKNSAETKFSNKTPKLVSVGCVGLWKLYPGSNLGLQSSIKFQCFNPR